MRLRTIIWWIWGIAGWILFLATYFDGEKRPQNEVPPALVTSQVNLPALPKPPPKPETPKIASPEIRKISHPTVDESVRMATRLGQQEPEKAIDILKKALELHPESADSLEAQIGLLYSRQLGQPEKSLPYFESSLLKNPNQPDILSELVGNYSRANSSKQAEFFLQRLSQEQHPKSAGPTLAYADWLATQGRNKEAISNLERRASQLESPWEAYSMAANLSSREAMRAQANARTPEEARRAVELSTRSISNYEAAISNLENRVRSDSSSAPRRSLYEVRLSLATQLLTPPHPNREAALQQIELILNGPHSDNFSEIRTAAENLKRRISVQ